MEKWTTTKNSMTRKPDMPHAHFMEGPTDVLGRKLDGEAKGFDRTLITYRHISQTKSRTPGNYWLRAIYPENFIDISAAGAQRLKLRPGDQVKVVSPNNAEGIWGFGREALPLGAAGTGSQGAIILVAKSSFRLPTFKSP